jgi:hypothetical protein
VHLQRGHGVNPDVNELLLLVGHVLSLAHAYYENAIGHSPEKSRPRDTVLDSVSCQGRISHRFSKEGQSLFFIGRANVGSIHHLSCFIPDTGLCALSPMYRAWVGQPTFVFQLQMPLLKHGPPCFEAESLHPDIFSLPYRPMRGPTETMMNRNAVC